MGGGLVFVLLAALAVSEAMIGHSLEGNTGKGYKKESNCRRPTNSTDCYSLQNATCFGAKLNYVSSTAELVREGLTLQQIQSEMSRWEGLKSSPKCWALIQPLLCTVYMPKCQDGIVDLPSQELCKIARSSCRVVELAMKGWPEFLKCDEPARFPANCENTEIRDLRFNTSSKCLDPMIPVDNSFNYYEGFEGCGLKCQDPLYTDEQHEYISRVISYASVICFLATGLVIMTYMLDWKSAQGYPSVIIFYVNVCYFIATVGWMLQFLPNAKQDIVCRKDATIRRNELNAGENVFCVLVFVLIYFGSMAALGWLVVFAYVWDLTCNSLGRVRERIDRQAVYFHALSWLFSLVLTAISLSLGKVEGNSMTGICFVGYMDANVRIGLVLIPVTVAFATMSAYLWKGFYRLMNVLLSSSNFIPENSREQIKGNAMRVLAFSIVASVITLTFLGLEINQMQMRPVWQQSLRESLVCNMSLTEVAECEISEKPGITFLGLDILMFFAGGVLVSSWAWTGASLRTWKRSLSRWANCCGSDKSNNQTGSNRVRKDRLIAQAYEKRHQIPLNGRLSLSLNSTHEDPIGLNRMLDPNRLCQAGRDVESNTQLNQSNTEGEHREDVSSEWAAALPHLLSRRGGIVPQPSSNSVSCVSEDNSRRPSCDSAMSELAIRQLRNSNSDLDRHESKRNRRRDWFKMGRRNRNTSGNKQWGYSWRRGHGGSSSSLESNAGPSILPAITALIDKRLGGQGLGGEATELQNPNNKLKKPITMKELAIQTSCTSIEKLSVLPSNRNNVQLTVCNNLTMCDKSTQWSLHNLNEVGTQTKKSSTKKEKGGGGHISRRKGDKETKETNTNGTHDVHVEDPVLKLLTPG